MEPIDERDEELESLTAIFPEIVRDSHLPHTVKLDLAVTPSNPLRVRFVSEVAASIPTIKTYAHAAQEAITRPERDAELTHLPPLHLVAALPDGYPAESPPEVHLTTQDDWLAQEILDELEAEVVKLWDEYGRCQILFAYIDHLQQAAERGFDLEQSAEGGLILPAARESELVAFDEKTKIAIFDSGSHECTICLEPKKGSACYQLKHCGHVFCRQCLQDFYNNAISEGDVAGIKCLSPDCGKADAPGRLRGARRRQRSLHPRELLTMGIDEDMVRRYVEMKRKKRLEADKSTVYCPRTWCQGPAKTAKYPPIPSDLSTYVADESSSEDEEAAAAEDDGNGAAPKRSPSARPDPTEQLAVCEKCQFAFCKVCYTGWHGPFVRCRPRNPGELSAEERASYDYIRLHTSPCPSCSSPTQKTMGCNHMSCFQCRTHYCYLCGAWLHPQDPYRHFNRPGTPCFERLWELDEGDEGQAPGDGQGFAGGRGWEQIAIEVAREADEREAADAARADEDDRVAVALDRAAEPQAVAAAAAEEEAQPDQAEAMPGNDRAAGAQQPRRRRRNPFIARPHVQGRHGQHAQAVRNHERNRDGRHVNAARNADPPRWRPAGEDEEHWQQELHRFLELARIDQEDEWDSDGLGEDEDFDVR